MGKGVVFFLSFFVGISVWADFSAEIYEKDSNKSKKLFNFENKISVDKGQTLTVTIFKNAQGDLALEDKCWLEGSALIKMEFNQAQLGELATIEVKENKIFFTKTGAGKTKTADEELEKPFVVSCSFTRFIRDNWEKILKGDKVKFRYGSWERMETVGFEVFKVGEGQVAGQPIVEIKMKASSFIIAAIVDPIFFKFSSDGSKLLEMRGRVAPKQKQGEKWKDLDAEAVYFHKN